MFSTPTPRRYALMSNIKNKVFPDNKFKDKFMEALYIEIFKTTNVLWFIYKGYLAYWKSVVSFGVWLVVNYCCFRNRKLFIIKRVLSILKINKGKPFKTGIKIGYMRFTSYSRLIALWHTDKENAHVWYLLAIIYDKYKVPRKSSLVTSASVLWIVHWENNIQSNFCHHQSLMIAYV